MTRADCCQTREDTARVLLANSEALPDSIWGATDCLNPGGGFPASTFRNYSCAGSAPARFVYIALFCATVGRARVPVAPPSNRAPLLCRSSSSCRPPAAP